VPVNASNCVITKLKITPDRQTLIDRKAAGRGDKSKGKYTQQDVQN
jgi:hypothetical protein